MPPSDPSFDAAGRITKVEMRKMPCTHRHLMGACTKLCFRDAQFLDSGLPHSSFSNKNSIATEEIDEPLLR